MPISHDASREVSHQNFPCLIDISYRTRTKTTLTENQWGQWAEQESLKGRRKTHSVPWTTVSSHPDWVKESTNNQALNQFPHRDSIPKWITMAPPNCDLGKAMDDKPKLMASTRTVLIKNQCTRPLEEDLDLMSYSELEMIGCGIQIPGFLHQIQKLDPFGHSRRRAIVPMGWAWHRFIHCA